LPGRAVAFKRLNKIVLNQTNVEEFEKDNFFSTYALRLLCTCYTCYFKYVGRTNLDVFRQPEVVE
jgi:hypothetical protein